MSAESKWALLGELERAHDRIAERDKRIAELEAFVRKIMLWLDVGVSGTEALHYCDEAEELLQKGKK